VDAASPTINGTHFSPQYACFLGLGANLGNKAEAFRAAVTTLDANDRIAVDFADGIASLYETTPVGCTENQPNYQNSAIRIVTTLAPHDLLAVARNIEVNLGRKRKTRWGARSIDIDLLLYGVIVSKQSATRSPALVPPQPWSRGSHSPNQSRDREGAAGVRTRTNNDNTAPTDLRGSESSASKLHRWITVNTETLTLPHPRLDKRRFVLEPLAEIAAPIIHPTLHGTMAELARRCAENHADQGIIRIAGPQWLCDASVPKPAPSGGI